jgi:uncharacterized protein YaiI (UPF0178 family)
MENKLMHSEEGPRILVDADACPVKGEIARTAGRYGLKVMLFIDTGHELSPDYGEVITVEKGRDSVDIALINRARRGDIVVTQDYGLAAMAVGRGAFALHPAGFVYHEGNLDRLLFERHLHGKIRSAGGRTKGPKKRHPEEDMRFREALERVCRNAVQSQK